MPQPKIILFAYFDGGHPPASAAGSPAQVELVTVRARASQPAQEVRDGVLVTRIEVDDPAARALRALANRRGHAVRWWHWLQHDAPVARVRGVAVRLAGSLPTGRPRRAAAGAGRSRGRAALRLADYYRKAYRLGRATSPASYRAADRAALPLVALLTLRAWRAG